MKKIQRRDKNKRNILKQQELKTKVRKHLKINEKLYAHTRWKIIELINFEKNYNLKISLTNLCIHTLNKKRVNRILNISRWEFLRDVRTGSISGFKKAVW